MKPKLKIKRTIVDLMTALAFGAGALLGGPGCALTPPFKSEGPAVSREGVQVTVTKQRCDEVEEPGRYGWDLVETILEVQIRNATATPLTVHRDAFRLRAPDGTSLATQTWGAAAPFTIGSGATGTFELRFMTRGGLTCGGEMVLEVAAGLALPEGPVRVSGVRFVPSAA
jgi:hypothetical protein